MAIKQETQELDLPLLKRTLIETGQIDLSPVLSKIQAQERLYWGKRVKDAVETRFRLALDLETGQVFVRPDAKDARDLFQVHLKWTNDVVDAAKQVEVFISPIILPPYPERMARLNRTITKNRLRDQGLTLSARLEEMLPKLLGDVRFYADLIGEVRR